MRKHPQSFFKINVMIGYLHFYIIHYNDDTNFKKTHHDIKIDGG